MTRTTTRRRAVEPAAAPETEAPAEASAQAPEPAPEPAFDPAPAVSAGPTDMPPEIAAAIVQVMGEIEKLKKSEHNAHAKYNYVSADAFFEAVGPLCSRAGLAILQDETDVEIIQGGGNRTPWLKVGYDFTLVHRSGKTYGPLHRTVMVPANGAQAFGSSSTYTLKQFQRALFQIPTGDKDDADQNPHEPLPESRSNLHGVPPSKQPRERKAGTPGDPGLPTLYLFDENGVIVGEYSRASEFLDALEKRMFEEEAVGWWMRHADVARGIARVHPQAKERIANLEAMATRHAA